MRLSSRKTLRETERWFVVSHRRGSSHVHMYMSTYPCARVYAYKTREKETWGLHLEVLSNLFTLSLPRSSWDPLVSLRVSPLSSVCPSVRTIILTECPPTATLFLQHSVLQVQLKFHDVSLSFSDKSSPKRPLLPLSSYNQCYPFFKKKSQQYKVKQKFPSRCFSWAPPFSHHFLSPLRVSFWVFGSVWSPQPKEKFFTAGTVSSYLIQAFIAQDWCLWADKHLLMWISGIMQCQRKVLP